jgi:hypothetical protein
VEHEALVQFGLCFLGHAVLALFLLLAAAWALRGRYQGQVDRQVRRDRRIRARTKPAIGLSDPLFWKERYVDDGAWRVLGHLSSSFRAIKTTSPWFIFLVYFLIFFLIVLYFVITVLDRTTGREPFLPRYYIWLPVGLFGLGLLAAAVRAASGIATEKDRLTWDALLASPLPTSRLLTCRLLGGFLSARWLLLFCFLSLLPYIWQARHVMAYGFGGNAGTGFFQALFYFFLLAACSVGYFWFTLALAGLFSLRGSSSIRNVLATLAVLLTLNGFPLVMLGIFGGSRMGDVLFQTIMVISNPVTSYLIIVLGLFATACVIAYHRYPKSRWLIETVKWIGYVVGLNVTLFAMLAGLIIPFGINVAIEHTSMFFSPIVTFYWMVRTKLAFDMPPWRMHIEDPTFLAVTGGLFFGVLGFFVFRWSLRKLRHTCGRIDEAKHKPAHRRVAPTMKQVSPRPELAVTSS